jgi:hypothetical protein
MRSMGRPVLAASLVAWVCAPLSAQADPASADRALCHAADVQTRRLCLAELRADGDPHYVALGDVIDLAQGDAELTADASATARQLYGVDVHYVDGDGAPIPSRLVPGTLTVSGTVLVASDGAGGGATLGYVPLPHVLLTSSLSYVDTTHADGLFTHYQSNIDSAGFGLSALPRAFVDITPSDRALTGIGLMELVEPHNHSLWLQLPALGYEHETETGWLMSGSVGVDLGLAGTVSRGSLVSSACFFFCGPNTETQTGPVVDRADGWYPDVELTVGHVI